MAESQTFYIDCEFDGHGGPLLSIAMVSDDGRSIHITTNETAREPWVLENVVPLLEKHSADIAEMLDISDVGGALKAFIGDCEMPVIIADSPVDIGRFCAAISTGSDGGWASADYPRMCFGVENVDCYPTTVPGAIQHNAYWDAMALRAKWL